VSAFGFAMAKPKMGDHPVVGSKVPTQLSRGPSASVSHINHMVSSNVCRSAKRAGLTNPQQPLRFSILPMQLQDTQTSLPASSGTYASLVLGKIEHTNGRGINR
jgi:hypothetical protein